MMFAIRDNCDVALMFAYRSKRSRRLEANDGRYFLRQLLLRNETRINIDLGRNG